MHSNGRYPSKMRNFVVVTDCIIHLYALIFGHFNIRAALTGVVMLNISLFYDLIMFYNTLNELQYSFSMHVEN